MVVGTGEGKEPYKKGWGERATRRGQVCRAREDRCEAEGEGQEEPERGGGEKTEREREIGSEVHRMRGRDAKK